MDDKVTWQLQKLLIEKEYNNNKVCNSISKNKNYKDLKLKILNITNYLDKYEKISWAERIYCILNNLYDRPNCKNCNNKVKFHNGSYRDFCSPQCGGIYNKDRIGNSNKQNYKIKGKEINEKRKQTCIERYNVDNVTKLEKVRDKMKQTLYDKTGFEFALQNSDSKSKYKQTCIERFNVDNPSKSQDIKNKKIQTSLQNYGCEYYWQNETNKQKIDNIILKRYGVTNAGMLSQRTYSKISQKLFWSIYNNLPDEIKDKTYFAELNKEFDIFYGSKKQYRYDFVISDLKICIEYNGDIWHANPYYYKAEDYHPIFKSLLNKDIWQNDINKYNELSKRGYSLLIIWESDYKKNKEKIIENINSYINNKYRKKEIK